MAFVWLIILCVGLLQGAFIISSFQALFPRGQRKTKVFRFLKALQVLPILLMLASEIWFFFVVFLPVEVVRPYSSIKGLLYILTSCYLWINMIFNYLAAMIVSPGYPETRQELEQGGEELHLVKHEFCPKCTRLREKGTHHCSSCSSCVQAMSHHCPFTNNCIGLDNYVYFYLFIFYCFLGLVWSSYCTFTPFMACMIHSTYDLSLFPGYSAGVCTKLGEYAVMFLVVVLMLVFMALVFAFHTLLLLADMAMIDFLKVCHKLTSPGQLGRGLLERCWRREKRLFRKLIWHRRKRWWKFFLPNFNQEAEFFQTDDFII